MTRKQLFLVPVVVSVLTAAGTAQTVAQLSPAFCPANHAPKSIVLAPTGANLRAVVSMVQSSRQIRADVSPAVPVPYGVPQTFTRDQFCDAWYSRDFQKLVTAHRWGGIRVWEGTVPTLPLNGLSFTPTNYSHEGLKMFKDMVLYSEQHTSPTSQGGLEIYRMNSSGGLTFVGERLFTAGAGNALEVSHDGRIVWQWGDRNNTATDGVMRVYSTNGYTGNPILVNTVPHAYVKPYMSKDLEGNRQRNNLIGAMGWDGLRAVNTSIPTAPVINTIIPPTNVIFIDGCTFIPTTDFAVVWGLFKIGSIQIDFISYWFAGAPGLATMLAIFPTGGYKIDDIKASLIGGFHLHAVGRDRANALRPVLLKY